MQPSQHALLAPFQPSCRGRPRTPVIKEPQTTMTVVTMLRARKTTATRRMRMRTLHVSGVSWMTRTA